jgi:signal transduction histidine kinase
MNAIKNLSITQKLTFIITVISTAAVVVACLAFLVIDRFTFKEAMTRDLKTLSNVIGANSTAALVFDNPNDATETLASLRAEEHILAAAIYDSFGNAFASYHRGQAIFQPPSFGDLESGFQTHHVDVVEPIVLEADQIGSILIRSDLEELDAREKRYLMIASAFLVFAFCTAFVVSARFQRIVSVPIVNLAALARSVSIYKDYSVRADKGSQDETGLLIEAFNDMLTEIEVRDAALKNANDSLELRVGERTRELLVANNHLRKEIQERQSAENALSEREEQLLQSQKMDAIGKLAGGIAHDFNNQLAIVQGYTDMILEDSRNDSVTAHRLRQIANVVERASKLTQQLLLFSSKQAVQLRPLDLNQQVNELKTMLERLMKEDIGLQLELAPDLGIVHADPGNINQVITNLVLNARDAMPEGGLITIRTQMVQIDAAYRRRVPEAAREGLFVCLSIEDTGMGIPVDIREHIFEPFFTTKEPGKGTGLGLSVVYGIVQSHRGWVTVESHLGRGSRFDIFLQPHETSVELPEEESVTDPVAHTGHREGILLIEDELELGQMTQQLLTQKNYLVTLCQTTAEARSVFSDSPSSFDMVLSDVVLPDGRGPNVVFGLLKQKPGLKALLMTGYTDNLAEREHVENAGLILLQKPVPTRLLLEQIRNILDS